VDFSPEVGVTQLSIALNDMIQAFYVNEKIEFDILVIGESYKALLHVVDYMSKIFDKNVTHTMKILTMKEKNFEVLASKLTRSTIILTTPDEFELFNEHIYLSNEFPQKLKFFLYSYDFEDFHSNLFLNTSSISIDMHTFYMNENGYAGTIDLWTYEWFMPNNCNNVTEVMINRFVRATGKWIRPLKNYIKFQNFHRCPLVFDKTRNEITRNPFDRSLIGPHFEIFKILGEIANFTPYLGDELLNPNMFIFVSCYGFPMYERFRILHFVTYFEAILAFIVSPGASYSPYEKLYLPFDFDIWKCLGAVFGGAFIVIFLVNRLPHSFQEYFYGHNVHAPSLNVVGTFFG
jgi:hypothetical protein